MSITPITETIKYLYETDYDRWVLQTVQQLQDKNYEAIDWENLIDEVMDLGRRQRDKLISLLTRLFEHLLKLAYWESEREYNYRGWNGEIQNFRIQIKRLLKDSPSLKVYEAHPITLSTSEPEPDIAIVRLPVSLYDNDHPYPEDIY
ncbi:MAG: DUF29 domain-containing protein [Crocosphaera sp.]